MIQNLRDNFHTVRTFNPAVSRYAQFLIFQVWNFKPPRCFFIWNCFQLQILIYMFLENGLEYELAITSVSCCEQILPYLNTTRSCKFWNDKAEATFFCVENHFGIQYVHKNADLFILQINN